MSLNSKTKKVIVSSYTSTPVPSRPVSRAEEEEEEPERVPAPPLVPSYTIKRPPNQPWQNTRGVQAQYIPPPADKTVQSNVATSTEGSSRRRRQKKGTRPNEETSQAEA
ncbi:hypothetical protein SERLADRAFT_389286 [Serpula lacrymans var. lacrymans S7.9]|uniref:Uncharacterized protein n=1 Tax=Serpula lacrymans var. lacrymans (strain S7.9) TaxID=578457 RepID=F8NW41_SERL9|nr:uncharacterized protein SERLADRAFT_389286 [Serpula lacrymans var. lacrymans S7.9]EGO24298.1 hypothetical protein SERLADRAFT_389286 [Serpula lacrymans var. lacrymans S7.9]